MSIKTVLRYLSILIWFSKCSTVVRSQQLLPGQPLPPLTAPALTSYQYSRAKIMSQIRVPSSDLVLVAAHRGYWETYPENSWEAIETAGSQWEIVEADIKPDADGVPIVIHDLFVQHNTDIPAGLTPAATQLSQLSTSTITNAHVRDRFGFPQPNIHPMQAIDLFTNYNNFLQQIDANPSTKGNGYVLALDIKGDPPPAGATPSQIAAAAQKVWQTIKTTYQTVANFRTVQGNMNLGDSIVYKIEANVMPASPADIDTFIAQANAATNPTLPQSFNIIIVLNPTDASNDAVVAAYQGNPHIVAYEINYPYNGSTMQKYRTMGLPGAQGSFSTYYDLPEGVAKSTATCCGVTATDTNGAKIDYRSRWDYFSNQAQPPGSGPSYALGFQLITIDRPDVLEPFLQTLQLRNKSHILP